MTERTSRRAANVPTGTVTFLFTDIEGSTTLWENYPTRMPKVMERHDEILRGAVEKHSGYVFKTVGDAFCAAFSYPREALQAALAAQRVLFGERWGSVSNLRVRMALHTGAAEQEREGDYFGPALNRVARLLGAAHGGQVLVSSATYGQVYDHPELVDEGARFLNLGEHRLKDLTHPERVYQLAVPDLPERFPSLKTHEIPEEGDRYRIKDFLGSGGMAKVYAARDEKLDRDVAMKVLHPRYVDEEEFIKRFDREARSTAKLSHPNIVPVYDRGRKEDGAYYIVMEYLPGGTLKDLVVKEGPLSARTAVELVLQVAQALEVAHEEGIVHRDVKPQNVLLTRRGEAKVADFGICKAASETTLTRMGLMMGTPHYLSPELAEGEPATFQSDLYSLGVIFYEMLTSELPFEAETPAGIISKQLRGQVKAPREINPEVPGRVEAVVMRLLARDPKDRYPDATALIDDLKRVLRSLEEEKDKDGRLARPPSRTATAQKEEVFAGTVVGDMEAPSLVEVPDLVGKEIFLGSSVLANTGLTLGDQREASSEMIAEGEVIGQTPAAGTKVEPGSMVDVTVSSGSRKEKSTTVPDVSGRSIEEAGQAFEEAGLALASSRNEKKSLIKRAGAVISTEPSAGSEVEVGTSVIPTVSSGPRRMSPGAVRAGLLVVSSGLRRSRVIMAGLLATAVVLGLIIALIMWLETPQVPNLVGQTEEAAKDLAGDNFKIQVSNRKASREQPKGYILSQDPEPGGQAQKDSTISVVVSSGPAIIFQDDFSSDSGGWPHVPSNKDEGTIDFTHGGYVLHNLASSHIMFTTPGSVSTLKDAVVEVDAAGTSGASDEMGHHEAASSEEGGHSQGGGHSHWGVICRRSSGNFYSMGISADGRSFILKTKNGSTSSLAEGNTSEAVNMGSETNHIQGDCAGSTLTLYANGQQLLTAEDEDFSSGQVGLFVSNRGTVSSEGTEVLFNDFSVSKP